MTATTPETLAQRMKEEIEFDAKRGILPPDVWSLSDLHQLVDSNKYGGLTDDTRLEELVQEFGGRDEDGSLPTGLTNVITEAENIVNRWLAEGALAGAPRTPKGVMTKAPWGSCSSCSSDTQYIRYISGPDGQRIAKVEYPLGMTQGEALANARAIKLAPEMAAFLQEAALLLKAHPEYAVGNSKVHYLAHKCMGLVTKLD